MRPFGYERASSIEAALAAVAGTPADAGQPTLAKAQFIAGGTNMSDYMKLGVTQPGKLVDVNRLQDPALRRIEVDDRSLRFGALVRMSEAENHPQVKQRFPAIADSLMLAASPQIRNMASLAGNVLQRTRCEYFREITWPCNKREPGSGCSALGGINRQHAVLGVSDACIATYHGDFAQVLVAFDASVDVAGTTGRRSIPFAELHRLPGDTPQIETALRPDEMITAITVQAPAWAARSKYLKVRDRQSYAFALASAAVALDMDGDIVREARIALGGVATVPWRARAAEAELHGKRLDQRAATAAASKAFADARPAEHNAFKIVLGQETLVRALMETRDMEI